METARNGLPGEVAFCLCDDCFAERFDFSFEDKPDELFRDCFVLRAGGMRPAETSFAFV